MNFHVMFNPVANDKQALQPQRYQHTQSGMSLIEVLVSVLILSIGLLGIAAMQSLALRNGQSSLERGQAVVQSYSILDAIRADRDNAVSYNTNGMRCTTVAAPAGSNTGQVAANSQLNNWVNSIKVAMGNASDTSTCGQVRCTADAVCTVTVQWDDSRSNNASGTGSETRQAVTVAAL